MVVCRELLPNKQIMIAAATTTIPPHTQKPLNLAVNNYNLMKTLLNVCLVLAFS